MPLSERTVTPLRLGRRKLSEEEQHEDVVLDTVCQNIFLGAIVQLASLVRHADDIFCDLAEECQNVFDKMESISGRIQNIERIIHQLDSTEVKIPVGTLQQFIKVADHHVAKHGFDCDHFTSGNRPYSIKFSYSLCDVTPVHALRGVDMYRKDGLCSSHLFKLWPIALKDPGLRVDDMDLRRVFAPSLSIKRRYKPLKQRRKTIQSIDEIFDETSPGDLQSSKTDHMSKSQPILVSVDTSGAGFHRMASYRRSLREEEGISEREKQKRRRRTVSGVPDNILQEIEQFEKSRSTQRNKARVYSLDDLDQKDLDAKDEVMQQYLQDIQSAIAEREEEEYAIQKEAKLLKFLPCRRSRSLPRCIKLISSSQKDGLTRSSLYQKRHSKNQMEEFSLKQSAEEIHGKFTSSLSLGSQRSSRSSKRSSIIGEKIKTLVANTLKPRPKSLDFDLIDKDTISNEDTKNKTESKTLTRSSSLTRASSPSMPDGKLSRATSNESQIGPGTYYYFNHTLPRAQAKKYDFPWDSLPKDWTTSVKLREISRRRKEDRQSSSGNWSQSGNSSNRQSMESDTRSSQPSTLSQYSLGKDSGRESLRYSGERDGLDTGYMGDAASIETISDTKSMSNTDSDEWIRTLAERAASRGDVTSTSVEALANLSRLTKQNIRNLDHFVPGRKSFYRKRNDLDDDGESSVYSQDNEGFYTSFHSDSGLKRSATNLLDEDDLEFMITPNIRDTKSLQSMISYNILDGGVFRPFDDEGSDTLTSASSSSAPNLSSLAVSSNLPDGKEGNTSDAVQGSGPTGAQDKMRCKPVPPPPPPRVSSMAASSKSKLGNSETDRLSPVTESNEVSPDSSDHEVIYARLKKKTSISVHGFPSWCIGLNSDEDEIPPFKDSLTASHERLNAESSEVEAMLSSDKDHWLFGTLPRSQQNPSAQCVTDTTNSWPRIKRPNLLQPGILKTPEKDKMKLSANPKTLNFDPVVSLFDAQSPHSVQLPLSRLSSSDESSTSPVSESTALNTTSVSSDQLCPPNQILGSSAKSNEPAAKFHPSVPSILESKMPVEVNQLNDIFTNGKKTSNAVYASSSSDISVLSSELSIIHSTSSLSLTSFDSFDMSVTAPLVQSGNSLSGSSSTIALSDIDATSFTHVTAATDLSLSGSSLSLTWDTDYTPNTTPLITPVRTKYAKPLKPISQNGSIFPDKGMEQVNTWEAQDIPTSKVSAIQEPFSTSSSSSSWSLSSNQTTMADKTPSNSQASPSTLSTLEQFPNSRSLQLSESYKGQGCSSDKNNNKTAQLESVSVVRLSSVPTQLFSKSSQSMDNSRKDRRRSSPIVSAIVNSDSSSSAQSGNESMSSSRSSYYKDDTRRRRSGNDAYSHADNGLEPSSVFSHGNPTETLHQESKMPQIKHTLHSDSRTLSVQKSNSSGAIVRPDFPLKALSSIPSQSEESLNSQYSISSTNQLIGKRQKTDLTQPVLHSGSSSESLQSTSSAGRSDSYRVALMGDTDQMKLITKKNTHSTSTSALKPQDALTRFAQSRSLTVPAPNYYDDTIGRADSYRCAVGNTQINDIANRNSSYRLATNEEDVVISNSRMDACNLWTGRTGGSRDIRRMGITDVDQLKHYRNDTDYRTDNTLHAKKKLGVKTDTNGNISKSSLAEQKKVLRQNSKDRAKLMKTQSSTYVRFDPLFESGEDLRASSESLRPPSIVSIKTLASSEAYNAMLSEAAQQAALKSARSSQARKRSGSQGRKSSDDKSGLTILDSIKTTFKSIGGSKDSAK